ncbi:MAG: YncE family protein [Flavobacteriales bacterium]
MLKNISYRTFSHRWASYPSIKLPDDADNVRYGPRGKKIYVGYGNGGIAIIDATTFDLITKIELSGHPESFQIDGAAKKIYVTFPVKSLLKLSI